MKTNHVLDIETDDQDSRGEARHIRPPQSLRLLDEKTRGNAAAKIVPFIKVTPAVGTKRSGAERMFAIIGRVGVLKFRPNAEFFQDMGFWLLMGTYLYAVAKCFGL